MLQIHNYDVKGGWDKNLDWANIPKNIDSPTAKGEKLWQTVARLGNDLWQEAQTHGAGKPAPATITEATDIARFGVSYGLALGDYFDAAVNAGFEKRINQDGAEAFSLEMLMGEYAANPDDVNPRYGKPGETGDQAEQDATKGAISEDTLPGKREMSAKHTHVTTDGCGGPNGCGGPVVKDDDGNIVRRLDE